MGKRSKGSLARRVARSHQLDRDGQLPGQMAAVVAEQVRAAPLRAVTLDDDRPEPMTRRRLEGLAARAVVARGRAEDAELGVVAGGRRLGVSWDELGEMLARSGETLRRRYVRLLVDQDQADDVVG